MCNTSINPISACNSYYAICIFEIVLYEQFLLDTWCTNSSLGLRHYHYKFFWPKTKATAAMLHVVKETGRFEFVHVASDNVNQSCNSTMS